MRSLALLGLITLSTLPLAARDHGWHRGWRDRCDDRPRVWVEDHERDLDRWDRDRWDGDRWAYRESRWARRPDCDDDEDVVVVRPLRRPLPPPWRGRVVLRFGW
ncbi:MAG TPA: hypothetical protein VF768_10315 [Holophagaceae bacterium]